MTRVLLALPVIAAQLLCACDAAIPLAPREGFIEVPGGPVWYRVFGSGTATPLLIVHGGPGGSSCSFEPLAARVSLTRPVVVYDQLGSGRSGRPMDRSLWTVERSAQELAAIRKALGLRKVHLMGHSWGGAVVADYLIRRKPAGIESVVLGAPLLSTRAWLDDADALRSQLPEEVQSVLRRNELAGTVKSKEYEEATEAFYDRFVRHQRGVKRPDSCAQAPFNQEIYEYMWGVTEFNATGTLLAFDVTPRLREITMPAMFVVGRYDEVRVETAEKFQAAIPGSVVQVIDNAGHSAPLEAYDAYAAALENFFRAVERGSRRH